MLNRRIKVLLLLFTMVASVFISVGSDIFAADPYDDDTDRRSYMQGGMFEFRSDRDYPYIRGRRTGDYIYKYGSANLASSARPRIATFVNESTGRYITLDICFPGTLVDHKPGSRGDKPIFYDIRDEADHTKESYRDQWGPFQRAFGGNAVWEGHKRYADPANCRGVSRADITPFSERSVEVKVKIKDGQSDSALSSANAEKLAFLKESGNFRIRLVPFKGDGELLTEIKNNGKEYSHAISLNAKNEGEFTLKWKDASISPAKYGIAVVGVSGTFWTLDTNKDSEYCGGDKSKKCFNAFVDDSRPIKLPDVLNNMHADYRSQIEAAKNDGEGVVQPGGSTDDPTQEEDSEDQNSCDVQMNSPLSWILCPVIRILEGSVNRFFTAANDTLNFKIVDGESEVKEAWVSIRNIANILFIVSFLFIIISQSIVGKL